ncbi:acyl-CoA dehydrogenase family protein [Methyloversatilis thermotolerans]|uniref:acyl-CoA dehydrogenase family protein n=1 Tax=Methyloversatilis thermotolerans TaxID=1346290 RepID=UPI00037BCC8E|nr:acyl-CoA dehydrogenase family protein [Methyloversatilis thermotolerans]
MSASALAERAFPAAADDLSAIRALIASSLAPKVLDIDQKAEYPEQFLRALGAAGGYRGAAHAGPDAGLAHVIDVMDEVARECVSTAFTVWCQTACARYIQQSDNEGLKRSLLPRVLSGERLAGTGLSNTLKSGDGIEDYRLSAVRVDGGYRVNGVLPWVSNLGPDHVFVTGCPVLRDGTQDGLMFMLIDCAQEGFRLVDCAHFVGLEGTRTLACHFRDTFVPDAHVLAHPEQSAEYVKRIKPGMIHGQMGMGLGLVEACIRLMEQSNRTHAHVNQYLDDQVGPLRIALDAAREQARALALQVDAGSADVLDILKLRLAGGELALRAAQAAMLHMGAKGYLLRSPAQRRLREAYFIAIVTPATKHLRREIARIEAARAAVPA